MDFRSYVGRHSLAEAVAVGVVATPAPDGHGQVFAAPPAADDGDGIFLATSTHGHRRARANTNAATAKRRESVTRSSTTTGGNRRTEAVAAHDAETTEQVGRHCGRHRGGAPSRALQPPTAFNHEAAVAVSAYILAAACGRILGVHVLAHIA